jgi:hypothetical protein
METIKKNKKTNKRVIDKYLLQRFMILIVMTVASIILTTCKGDENGNNSNESLPEKMAVKYLWVSHLNETGVTRHWYITFDKFTKLSRDDMYSECTDHDYCNNYTEILNHNNKTYWENIGNSGWTDKLYNANNKIKGINTFVLSFQNILSIGYKKQPTQKLIAGKSCDIYTLTTPTSVATVGMWKNVALLYEVDNLEPPSYYRWEAIEVNLDVPEVAFTKTMNITWLTFGKN